MGTESSESRARVRLCCWPLLALAALAAVGCGAESSAPPRWNVLLVVVDTLRADHLQAYGYDRSTTPFIDRFTQNAVIFEEARSQAGCTFPSVNSILTSRQPQLFLQTMKEHGWGIPEGIPTLGEMLQEVGYTTAAVSASPIIRVTPGPMNPDGGFGRGFSEFDETCEQKLPDGRTMGAPASCLNEVAYRILDGAAEPFFLYLHYFDPHDPYRPPADYQQAFAAADYDKPWVADGGLLPLYRMLYTDGPAVEFTDRDLAHALDLYDEEIRYFDSQFEQLIERLKRDGTLEHTLIILASDHGEAFMEHDHFFHCKDLTYDTVMKTPLIFWLPGLDRSLSVPALAQNLDIVPTVLDYLGIDAARYDLKGRSLRLLIEEERSIHRYVFGIQRHSRTVTDGRFKLTYNIKSGAVELFDLERDPAERLNVIARRPELGEELTAVLLRWVESVEGDVSVATRVEEASQVTERLRALGYL